MMLLIHPVMESIKVEVNMMGDERHEEAKGRF